jgi:SAM-dependent methyltransferase
MYEILRCLPADARVLDLGCGSGSFEIREPAATVIGCDLDRRRTGTHLGRFISCDARKLPFGARTFNAVILNHSLEHFEYPEAVLTEIRRVIRRPGYLYIAVPDASSITDHLYRWLARGGGHVNRFSNLESLVQLIERETGLLKVSSRLLFSSFTFLNRLNGSRGFGRRIYLFGGGSEWFLRLVMFSLRKIDEFAGTRTSIYGWALWFGSNIDVQTQPWSNVCIRCGSGHRSETLIESGNIRRGIFGWRFFRCPACDAKNYLTDDRAYVSMR